VTQRKTPSLQLKRVKHIKSKRRTISTLRTRAPVIGGQELIPFALFMHAQTFREQEATKKEISFEKLA